MSKQEMMDDIIKNRGLEDKYTILFCRMCEEIDNESALFAVYTNIRYGLSLDET